MNPNFPAAETYLAQAERELRSLDGLIDFIDERLRTATADERGSTVRAIVIGKEIDSVYSGIELLLQFLIAEIDGSSVDKGDWHAAVLAAAAADNPPVRPPLIGADTFELLHELRRFRHVVRHPYGMTLRLDRVLENLAVLRRTLPLVRRDFEAFKATFGSDPAPRPRRPRRPPR